MISKYCTQSNLLNSSPSSDSHSDSDSAYEIEPGIKLMEVTVTKFPVKLKYMLTIQSGYEYVEFIPKEGV